MTSRARQRVETAREKVDDRAEDLRALEQDILDELGQIDASWTSRAEEVEEIEVGLESTDVDVDPLSLVWIPVG